MSLPIVILLVLGLVLFVLAGFNVSHPRLNLLAFGLAAWIAAELLAAVPG